MLATFSSLDWIVLAAYGAVVVGIGLAARLRQRNTEDYFLGGRRMAWWVVGVSLIATSFSSSALIGGTGFGFTTGMKWLQLQLGDLIAIALACAVFMPFFAKLRLTTAYGYLEYRFGGAARTVASALFLIQTLLRAGILVYGPALALSAILGWDLRWAIVASGTAALLYSSAGVITAVVWTDLIQFAVVVIGIVYVLVLVAGDVPGGMSTVIADAQASDRLRVVDPALAWTHPFTILGAVLAYGALALSVAGTNQQAVQRYLACEDLRAARKAAFLGWGMGLVAVALTLFLGVALASWMAHAPDGAVLAGAGDEVLPRFIVHRIPAGLAGLLVAAIFAASMSSMDSAIHAMSTATLVDFVRRFRSKPATDATDLRLARILTAVFGVLATLVALYAAAAQARLLETLIVWLGYVAGPLLGLFLLGLLTRRANEVGALVGTAIAVAFVATVVLLGLPKQWAFHPLWLTPLSTTLAVSTGWLASLLGAAPPEARLRGLTWWDRARAREESSA